MIRQARDLLCLTACVFAALLALGSCQRASGPPGHLLIRNDIQDKQYNEFVVDDVHVKGARTSFRKTFRPGDEVVLPQKSVTKLRFTREYEGFSRVYIVSCPKNLSVSVTIKLIDVHTGRLNGGCKLRRKGKKIRGLVTWSEDSRDN